MLPRTLTYLALSACSAHATINEADFQASHIIIRDVAILGGGASGTYAAVRLREDIGASLVVIEREKELGGHVKTYRLPGSQSTINYGVVSYWRSKLADAFFQRFGIELVTSVMPNATQVYLDFDTGANLTSYKPPALPEISESLQTYLQLTKQYDPILLPGYWGFPTGNAIPAELLTSFYDFAMKYALTPAFPLWFQLAGVGLGGLKNISTFEVMGLAASRPSTEPLITRSFVKPKSGDNGELYRKAYELLKHDTFLNSEIIYAERSSEGVRLVLQRNDGQKCLIKAKQFLVTPPPSAANYAKLDLDKKESDVFGTSRGRYQYVGVIRTTLISTDSSVDFFPSAAMPNKYLELYQTPYTLSIETNGPTALHTFKVLVASNDFLNTEQAKSKVVDHILQAVNAGSLGGGNEHGSYGSPRASEADIEFLAFSDHNSVVWRKTAEEMKAGFVQNLYGLQGYRSTWYTGSLWCTDFSVSVWEFTETVLERMVKTLSGKGQGGKRPKEADREP